MFKFILSLFKREHWVLVKTIKINANYVDHTKQGFGYYHLFESSKGTRKVKFDTTLVVTPKFEEEMKQVSIYQETIFRWLNGRYDPNIPRYNDIPEEDTVIPLKGKSRNEQEDGTLIIKTSDGADL